MDSTQKHYNSLQLLPSRIIPAITAAVLKVGIKAQSNIKISITAGIKVGIEAATKTTIYIFTKVIKTQTMCIKGRIGTYPCRMLREE